MHAHLMCMKLALLASVVHRPRINIMKRILFALKRDASFSALSRIGRAEPRDNNERRRAPRDEPIEWRTLIVTVFYSNSSRKYWPKLPVVMEQLARKLAAKENRFDNKIGRHFRRRGSKVELDK